MNRLQEKHVSARPTISVCVATYNGSQFVAEQFRSILAQLNSGDEVIVVDDSSSDDTVEILRSLSDPRIILSVNTINQGHVKAFERAISLSSKEIVMLADQDDVWIGGRVDALSDALADHEFVASNWMMLDDVSFTDDPTRLREKDTATPWRNISRIFAGNISYFGCAMGFRREMLGVVLPFPAQTEAHDQWIAIVGNVSRSMQHLSAPSLRRRVHGSNLTSGRRSFRKILRSRVIMTGLVASALRRVGRARRQPASRAPKARR